MQGWVWGFGLCGVFAVGPGQQPLGFMLLARTALLSPYLCYTIADDHVLLFFFYPCQAGLLLTLC